MESSPSSETTAPETSRSGSEEIARRVLDVTRQVTLDLHPHQRRGLVVDLDSSLDRDLGFDSLGRVELLMRLEQVFHLRFHEALLAEAATPRDLVAAVLGGGVAEPLSAAAELRPLDLGEARAAPESASTLVEMLEWHVETHPERTHIILYGEGEREQEIHYRDLQAGAQRVAGGLHERGLGPGESVAIMLPTGRAFFETFFGVLYAGGVPVPIYPPFRPAQIEDHLRRQATILTNAQARVLVAAPQARAVAGLLRAQVPGLRRVETAADLRSGSAELATPHLHDQGTALIQYTSGSTGDPKGVELSHANLLANIRAMGRVMRADSSDVFVSWLPLYHDMGLIGAWLGCLYHAAPVVILSPLRFLSRPESWLWAIHRHRATLSAAPNFGYELCLRKVQDADIEGLDLSSWRMAVNGAEPVSPGTVRRFAERFRGYGFRPEAMAPVYGLAESSVGLAFPPLGRGPLIDRIDRAPLTGGGEAVRAPPEQANALEFVACGRPLSGHQIRVVDPTGREVPDRHQGRLQFKGPSVTRGYFRNPEKTAELFDGDWLESGDLAYVADGDVYLTGRTKDLIIRAGRNVYPHELEEAVGDLPGVRKGCVAAFASVDPRSQIERLVLLAETRESDPDALEVLRLRIADAAASLLETPLDEVVLTPPRTVLKTSSGKIRRAACRELYDRGAIGARTRAVWWQVARLSGTALARRLRSGLRRTGDWLYAGWWWTTVALCAVPAWILALMLPRISWRWTAVRGAARSMLWLSRMRIVVEGLENLSEAGGILLVNHSSYFDSLVLSAALPGEPSFVAKKELAAQRIAGPLLRRLDALFVERFDLQAGVEDTRRLVEAAREGRRIVSFPEGTLRRMPGLLPFKLGAFIMAAQAGVPVIPAGLRGTRSILRTDQWLPRRGAVHLRIGKPIQPRGSDWSAAIHLRDAARAEMLWLCGEPDLSEERVEF
jgi:1-acyl-sn-glycerol-3-phosphate acyltransferase